MTGSFSAAVTDAIRSHAHITVEEREVTEIPDGRVIIASGPLTSDALADKIDGAKFFKTFGEIESDLRETAQPGDIILTVGAGNVYKIGEHMLERTDLRG